MASKQNLYVDQGTTFTKTFVVNVSSSNTTPANLSGYIGRAQFRKEFTSANSINFSVQITPNVGQVTLTLNANVSSNIEFGRYVYDVEIESNTGIITRIVEGFLVITPEVTR